METGASHVVECFWPNVRVADLATLDARAAGVVAQLGREGVGVGYLGSLLLPEDEVVLCFFAGTRDAVTEAVQRAEIPFERILDSIHPDWPRVDVAPAIDHPDPGRQSTGVPSPGG